MENTIKCKSLQLKVLLIGSNPSIKSSSDLAFFLDSKSGTTLQTWIKDIDAEFIYANVSDTKTENNRSLTRTEIKTSLPNLLEKIKKQTPDKIVTLGKTAHEALTLLQLSHLEMPHPSGLNRKLNDKKYTEEKIKELAAFCAASSKLE